MQSTKRQLLKLSVCTAINSLMSGCITTAMYDHEEYTETVQSLLISQDRNHLIVMTDKYHYIFDTPSDIARALSAPYRSFLTASFGASRSFDADFYVKSSGEIEGGYTLTLESSAPPEFQSAALQAGYLPGPERDSLGMKALERRGTLRGKRYSANGEKPTLTEYYLNKRYSISVEAEQSYGRKAANIAATPITVAADGVVAIGTAAVVIVCIPFALAGLGFALGALATD